MIADMMTFIKNDIIVFGLGFFYLSLLHYGTFLEE